MAAIFCSLFTAPLYPLPYDPNLPSSDIYEHSPNIGPATDDTSWDDPLRSYNPGVNRDNRGGFFETNLYSLSRFTTFTRFLIWRLFDNRDAQRTDLPQPKEQEIIRIVK